MQLKYIVFSDSQHNACAFFQMFAFFLNADSHLNCSDCKRGCAHPKFSETVCAHLTSSRIWASSTWQKSQTAIFRVGTLRGCTDQINTLHHEHFILSFGSTVPLCSDPSDYSKAAETISLA